MDSERRGLEVDEVVAYRTEMAPDSSEAAREALCDGATQRGRYNLYKFLNRDESSEAARRRHRADQSHSRSLHRTDYRGDGARSTV